MEVFAEDLQCEVEGGGDVVVAKVQAGDERFGVLALAAEAGLLVVKELAGDAVLVVHVQELSLLLFYFFQNPVAAVDLLLGGHCPFAEVVGECLTDRLAFGLAERDAGVVIFDGGFNEIDGLVALGAFAALVAWADEILVMPAVAFVARVDQAAAAGAAADGALEVVLVLAVALAGAIVRLQHGLDLVEDLLADERLVPAGVLLAAVGDDAGVVGAGEHVMHRGQAQWRWGMAAITA